MTDHPEQDIVATAGIAIAFTAVITTAVAGAALRFEGGTVWPALASAGVYLLHAATPLSQTGGAGESRRRSYLSKILQPEERLLRIGRLHWINYASAIIYLALSVIILSMAPNLGPESTMGAFLKEMGLPSQALKTPMQAVGWCLFGVGLWKAVHVWFKRLGTEIAITNRRVIYKRGLIRRHTEEMNMDKIESVIVSQSLCGRILNYGSIHVRGTGEGLEHLHRIADPVGLRNCITAR